MKQSMIQTTMIGAVGALVLAGTALAQPGGARSHRFAGGEAGFGEGAGNRAERFERRVGHRSDRLAEFLELTEEQIAAWDAQREATRAQAEPIHQALKSSHVTLQSLLDEAAPDATAVGQEVINSRDLKEQVKSLHEAAEQDFVALLTDEQVTRFEAFQDMRPERKRRRSPGRRGGGHRGATVN